MSAGVRALSLLASPINTAVLQGLAGPPRSLADLRREAGSPPHTTMRDHLRALSRQGVVERLQTPEFAGSVGYELTVAGRGLLNVTGFVSAWLAAAPSGSLGLGSAEAKNAIRAVVDGWTSSIVRALAGKPRSLTELDSVITSVSYPSLERRLTAMRRLGLLEAVPGGGRGTPYGVTDWLRRTVPLMASASHWEHRNLGGEAPPITRGDIEAAFLLSLPLLRMSGELDGSCRMAVQVGKRSLSGLVGAMTEIQAGRVISCVTRLDGIADAWVLGSTKSWLAAIAKGEVGELEIGGDTNLAMGLVKGLYSALL